LAKLGVKRDICKRILNHVQIRDGSHAVYDRHEYRDEMLEALTKLEADILKIVGEVPPLAPRERAGQSHAVLAALKNGNAVMTVAEIAAASGVPQENTRAYLAKMIEERQPVAKVAKGQYRYCDGTTVVPFIPRKLERKGQWGAVLGALKSAGKVATCLEIVAATGLSYSAVSSGLFRMAKTGEVIKVGFAQYLHPDNQPKEQVS
jgi:hypothetical protein